jgi:hypothetical protein
LVPVFNGIGFKSKGNISLYQEKIKVMEKTGIESSFIKKEGIVVFFLKSYICDLLNSILCKKEAAL